MLLSSLLSRTALRLRVPSTPAMHQRSSSLHSCLVNFRCPPAAAASTSPPLPTPRRPSASNSRVEFQKHFSFSRRSTFSPSSAVAASAVSTSSSAASFSSSWPSSSPSFPRAPPEGTLITSPSNPFVKFCAKLRTSPSTRAEAGAALLSGATIISEVCRGGSGRRGEEESFAPISPRVLFLAPDAPVPEGVPAPKLTLRAPSEVLAKLAGLATTQGTSLTAVAVVDLPAAPESLSLSFLSSSSSSSSSPASSSSSSPPLPRLRRLLALDGVQDPGNVGTLSRAALALGWDSVWCLPGTADPWGDKAVRASRGAAWRIPIFFNAGGAGGRGGWKELLSAVESWGLDVVVADPHASASSVEDDEEEGEGDGGEEEDEEEEGEGDGGEEERGVCLVLGSEGSGLSDQGRKALAKLSSSSSSSSSSVSVRPVAVPMSGEMESLNVATAGAILMFALSEEAPAFVEGLHDLRKKKRKVEESLNDEKI